MLFPISPAVVTESPGFIPVTLAAEETVVAVSEPVVIASTEAETPAAVVAEPVVTATAIDPETGRALNDPRERRRQRLEAERLAREAEAQQTTVAAAQTVEAAETAEPVSAPIAEAMPSATTPAEAEPVSPVVEQTTLALDTEAADGVVSKDEAQPQV